MTEIEVNGLTVRYGTQTVLENISFSVVRGDFLAILGPNGSGKTTLVRTILGLVTPVSGSITFPGRTHGVQAEIGYLPQNAGFSDPRFPASVREVVATGLLARKRFPRRFSREDRERTDEVLGLLRIKDLESRRVGILSGGQRQRVHLARALISRPSILILDEPTGALDPETRECFTSTLKTMNRSEGITIIVVTHDTHSIAEYARTVLYLDSSVVYYGPVSGFEKNIPRIHYFGGEHMHTNPEGQ